MLQAAGAEKKQATQADAEQALGRRAGSPDASRHCRRWRRLRRDVAAGTSRPAGRDQGRRRDPGEVPVDFIDETEPSLDALTADCWPWRAADGGGRLKGLLVTAHRIKGSAASIGLNRAAKLAHLMEDLLEHLVTPRQLTPPRRPTSCSSAPMACASMWPTCARHH